MTAAKLQAEIRQIEADGGDATEKKGELKLVNVLRGRNRGKLVAAAVATVEAVEAAAQFRSLSATTGAAPAATLRGLSASADEPEEPRYTACSAGASSYSVGGSEMEQQVLEEEDERALEKLEAIANGFEAAGDHYHAAVARELRARFLEPEM